MGCAAKARVNGEKDAVQKTRAAFGSDRSEADMPRGLGACRRGSRYPTWRRSGCGWRIIPKTLWESGPRLRPCADQSAPAITDDSAIAPRQFSKPREGVWTARCRRACPRSPAPFSALDQQGGRGAGGEPMALSGHPYATHWRKSPKPRLLR